MWNFSTSQSTFTQVNQINVESQNNHLFGVPELGRNSPLEHNPSRMEENLGWSMI
jgi:hypothetical protein